MKNLKKTKEKFGLKKFLIEFLKPNKKKIITFIIATLALFVVDIVGWWYTPDRACFPSACNTDEKLSMIPWDDCMRCVDMSNSIAKLSYTSKFTFHPFYTLGSILGKSPLAFYFIFELIIYYLLVCIFYHFKKK